MCLGKKCIFTISETNIRKKNTKKNTERLLYDRVRKEDTKFQGNISKNDIDIAD